MSPATPALWSAAVDGVEVRFVGRGPRGSRRRVLAEVGGGDLDCAWLRQRHSPRCYEARPGEVGEGDALWTRQPGLALCVVTADCVPVVIASGAGLAAIHAGWRGIAAGVVRNAISALDGRDGVAWIGPAIGPCCYEVGDEVADRVVAASGAEVARPGPAGRPHLDLPAAVEAQLRHGGVAEVERLGPCTRCSPDLLWSYRRAGRRAGRNLTFAWLR